LTQHSISHEKNVELSKLESPYQVRLMSWSNFFIVFEDEFNPCYVLEWESLVSCSEMWWCTFDQTITWSCICIYWILFWTFLEWNETRMSSLWKFLQMWLEYSTTFPSSPSPTSLALDTLRDWIRDSTNGRQHKLVNTFNSIINLQKNLS